MIHILKFIKDWLIFPVAFTLCYILCYFFAMLLFFKIPKVNYRKAFFDETYQLNIVADIISVGVIYGGIVILFAYFIYNNHFKS